MATKITDDFRMYCAGVYCLAAIIILYFINANVFNAEKLSEIHFFIKSLWSFAFCSLGFSLLILKICINSIHDSSQNPGSESEIEITKRKWRYFTYYPIMLLVLTTLSVILSNYYFRETKLFYFEASALLSFFFGYFIDSLPNIIEKLGGKASGSD